jgi:hypothetical protein
MNKVWIIICVIISVQAADNIQSNKYDIEPDKKETPTDQDAVKLKKYGLYRQLRALMGTKKGPELEAFRLKHGLSEEELERMNKKTQESSLHVAAYSGDQSFLQWLFKYKKYEEIKGKTATRYTPYDIAVEEGYDEMANMLNPSALTRSKIATSFKNNTLFFVCLLLMNLHILMIK